MNRSANIIRAIKIKKKEMNACTKGRYKEYVQGIDGETWGKETTEKTYAYIGE